MKYVAWKYTAPYIVYRKTEMIDSVFLLLWLLWFGYEIWFVNNCFKVIQNGVKPFINEIVKKSCFHVDI